MTTIDVTPDVLPVIGSAMPDIIPLDLDCIRIDEAIKTREVREGEALERLVELYRDDPFALPPIVVFCDEAGVYWLADGHYRLQAAREALGTEGPRTIRAEVRYGTKRDAVLYAAGANIHGLCLSSAEKRRVVTRLLQDDEWGLWGDRKIARHTGTSHVFVGKVRKALAREAALAGNGYHPPMDGEAPFSSDEEMERVLTKELGRLQNAWRAASPPARRAFLEWLATQPVEDLVVVASSEETRRFSDVIATACPPAALIAAPAPDGLLYIPDFLSPAEQEDLLERLRALSYEHARSRGNTMKRAWAQFGYNYVATSRKLTPAPPIPPFLQAVIDKAAPYYPEGLEFAQCIVTHYPPEAGIGWHKDAPGFGDCILGVSLASEAMLQFKTADSVSVSATYEVSPSPGSLYLMQGAARWDYKHRLVPVRQERYSLTFRTVL